MRQSRLNVFWGLAVLSVVLLVSAGPAAPDAQAGPQWEYGTYEVAGQARRRVPRTFRWQTRESIVSAEEDKFHLFMKLGIYCTIETAHELMLCNHLGKEGWEFVTHHSASTLHGNRTMTIFRRLRN